MQALLAEYAWDWHAALEGLQRFVLAHLADPDAILVLDETAELKKGTMTVGVGRQHAGITGQIENCQTVVFLAYVTARAHTLFSFRLCLPKQWCADRRRRERAQVPEGTVFATKTVQGTEMPAGEPAGPLGRAVALGVEDAGDLLVIAARGGELGDAGEEGEVVGQLAQAGDGPDGLPGGLVPAGPGDGDVDQLAVPGDADGDVLDQDAQQLLAVGLRRRRSVPDPGQVTGQGLDGGTLGRGEGGRLLFGEPLVIRLQPPGLGEGGFPVRLQLPGHQAVLRLGELVLAAGPAGGVAGALDPLAPQLVQHGPLGLGLGGGGHGDLQRGRRHRRQDLAGDVVVEGRAGDVLAAPAGPVVDLEERARVAVRGPRGS
ncbi:MAG: transposase [Streptosporangiaceae bacterium]